MSVLVCLVVPVLWGVISARVYDWWLSRRPARDDNASVEDTADASLMYYI
jgi:hypothetical protein